jgi:hypothetical protein
MHLPEPSYTVERLAELLARKYLGKLALVDGRKCRIQRSKDRRYGKLVALDRSGTAFAYSWTVIEDTMTAGGFFNSCQRAFHATAISDGT